MRGLRVSWALKGRVHRPFGSQSVLCSLERLWLRRGFVIPVRPGCASLVQRSPDQLNETTCHINLTDYCTTGYPSVWKCYKCHFWIACPFKRGGQVKGKSRSHRQRESTSAGRAAHLQAEPSCRSPRRLWLLGVLHRCIPAGWLIFWMAHNNNTVCTTKRRCQIPFVHYRVTFYASCSKTQEGIWIKLCVLTAATVTQNRQGSSGNGEWSALGSNTQI